MIKKIKAILSAYAEDGVIKTQDVPIGREWAHMEACEEVSLDQMLSQYSLPDGEYQITLKIEKK